MKTNADIAILSLLLSIATFVGLDAALTADEPETVAVAEEAQPEPQGAPEPAPNPNPHPHITGAVKGSDIWVSGCVIRFTGLGGYPEIHANGAHRCAGYRGLHINSAGEIAFRQTVTEAGRNPILFAMCQADERTGGRQGIVCGASGGTDETRYALYSTEHGRQLDLRAPRDLSYLEHRFANLWVGAIHAPGSWG